MRENLKIPLKKCIMIHVEYVRVGWELHAYFIWKRVKSLKNIVYIDGEFITLGQLLKHVNVISSGGMAKWYLSEHAVFIDNEKENRRGKKIYPGSMVEIPGEGTFFVRTKESDDAASAELEE